MWKEQKNDIVSVIFNDNKLILSLIQRNQNLPHLSAYSSIVCKNGEFFDGIIYNFPVISKRINDFLTTYHLQQARIMFCISGKTITEQWCTSATAHELPRESLRLFNGLAWKHLYLCPCQDQTGFWHYASGISHEHIFQYHLLALNMRLNVIACTTPMIGYLAVYQQIYGQSFRQSQLSIDFERHNCQLDAMLSPDIIARMVTVPNTIPISVAHDYKHIALALGLFLAGESLYENN